MNVKYYILLIAFLWVACSCSKPDSIEEKVFDRLVSSKEYSSIVITSCDYYTQSRDWSAVFEINVSDADARQLISELKSDSEEYTESNNGQISEYYFSLLGRNMFISYDIDQNTMHIESAQY